MVGVKDSAVAVRAATQEVAAGIPELKKNTLQLRLVVLLLIFAALFCFVFLHCSLHTVVIEALPFLHCIAINITIYLERPSTPRVRLGRCRRSLHILFTFAAYVEMNIQCQMHCSCVCVFSPNT